MVANGLSCQCIGTVSIPITLYNQTRIMEIIVVPSVNQGNILGVDFWTTMNLNLNMRQGECVIVEAINATSGNINSSADLTPT